MVKKRKIKMIYITTGPEKGQLICMRTLTLLSKKPSQLAKCLDEGVVALHRWRGPAHVKQKNVY